jgi:trehalose-phosphatase
MAQPLFEVLPQIAAQIEAAPRLLLCLDFDGTLTEFVGDPADAVLSERTARVLRTHARHEQLTLAIVSGRDRADLTRRVGIAGVIYAGNHGLDIAGPGYVFVEPTAAAKSEELRELAQVLENKLREIRGVIVEYKGLTVSVHYRRCTDAEAEEVRRLVHGTLAGATHPFVLRAGEKVHEIRPRVYWSKGTAVMWIREQLGEPIALPIYVGDDLTDEDAFTAVREGITVKVRDDAETAAHYRLAGPAEVCAFLEWLDDLLRHRGR